VTGADGHYVSANPAFQRMTGYSETELRGLSVADITHEDDRAATETILASYVAGDHSPHRFEKRYRRNDGGVLWVEISTFLVTVAGGPPLFAGIAVDLTERKRAEQALRDAQADLAHMARLTTMGELVASLAHEINQPLAGIATNASAGLRWLGQDRPDLDEARAAFSRIVRDGARAGDVMRGLRALARKAGPELASVDIDDAIHEVLALTRSELQRHGVVLQINLRAGDRPVVADRVQLQQVLMNLIVNGLEAMRAVAGPPRVLAISSEHGEPDGVLVGVADTGPGIDPAMVDRIFQPFVTTKRQGMGMGLSICRSIVEAHGGRLWASPALPSGAIFRFTIPGAPRASADPT